MIRSEEGVSAVEFALIAPLLFVLTFGIVEFSLLLFDKAVITNASREGARAAVVYRTDGPNYTPLSADDVRAIVKDYSNNYLVNLGPSGTSTLSDGDIIVAYENGTAASGDDVTVTVTFTYDFLVFPNLTQLIGGTFTGTIDLIGTTVMRME